MTPNSSIYMFWRSPWPKYKHHQLKVNRKSYQHMIDLLFSSEDFQVQHEILHMILSLKGLLQLAKIESCSKYWTALLLILCLSRYEFWDSKILKKIWLTIIVYSKQLQYCNVTWIIGTKILVVNFPNDVCRRFCIICLTCQCQ